MIALTIGGAEDHVHLLFHLPPKLALAKAVLLLKSNSSRWLSEQGREFSWQEGYGAFSVSSSNLDAVMRYIQNQEAHHRKSVLTRSFGRFSGSTALNMIRGTCLGERFVPPLRGSGAFCRLYPPLTRWAMFVSPLRG